MGIVCENCGWRENPNNNTGRKCIFTNTKKTWTMNGYNEPCKNYIMDIELRSQLMSLLGIDEHDDNPLKQKDKGELIISEVLNFYKKYQHTRTKIEWDVLHTATEKLYQKYGESNFLLSLLKETSKYIERKNEYN